MRTLLPALCCTLLMGCGGGPVPSTAPPAPAADSLALAAEPVPLPWTGYYDSFDGDEEKAVQVQLWIRSDSTFVLRRRSGATDEVPSGSVGLWTVVHPPGGPATGLFRIQHGGGTPDHYQRTPEGLLRVDVRNGFTAVPGSFLERLADDLQEEIPRMRVRGMFTYHADAMGFTPCGTTYLWPCAGGADQGDEEGEVLDSMGSVELQRAYLEAVGQGGVPWTIDVVCSMGFGPAMEGDGADEYVFIHKVLGAGKCP